MNTTALDLAFGALNESALSIFDDGAVRKKGDALLKSIEQFASYVTGEGFKMIEKEARSEPVIKLIPGLTREQSFMKMIDDDPVEVERQFVRPYATVPMAIKTAVIKQESSIFKAAADVLKANPGLTKEQAVAKALQLDPELYDAGERAKWVTVRIRFAAFTPFRRDAVEMGRSTPRISIHMQAGCFGMGRPACVFYKLPTENRNMTTGVFSILGFVAHLHAIERDMKDAEEAIVARACEMVCEHAKEILGSYQSGWPRLEPETIARKVMGDSPLLETGQLRDSISWTAHGKVGYVGSNLDKAVWMELGTSRVPPRPFLSTAAAQMEKQIHLMAVRAVRAAMRGEGLHGSEMAELLHVLKHVGHVLHQAYDKATEGHEEHRR